MAKVDETERLEESELGVFGGMLIPVGLFCVALGLTIAGLAVMKLYFVECLTIILGVLVVLDSMFNFFKLEFKSREMKKLLHHLYKKVNLIIFPKEQAPEIAKEIAAMGQHEGEIS